MGGSGLSELTVGRDCSRETSPEVRAFSPSLMVNIWVWSERKRRNSKGRGRERLPWLNAEEATGEKVDVEIREIEKQKRRSKGYYKKVRDTEGGVWVNECDWSWTKKGRRKECDISEEKERG